DRQHERAAPAVVIGEMAEQPAADWAHDEAQSEQNRRVQLLDDRIGTGEERAREVERKRRVGVEVVPLDEVADGSNEDGLEPTLTIGAIEVLVPADGRRDRARISLHTCLRCARLKPSAYAHDSK